MALKLDIDVEALRPLVRLAVAEAMERMEGEQTRFNGRLAFTEPEAAVLLGVKPHVLRDARLRGEISAKLVGKRYVYSRKTLETFLDSK